jgi:hypothetical protein
MPWVPGQSGNPAGRPAWRPPSVLASPPASLQSRKALRIKDFVFALIDKNRPLLEESLVKAMKTRRYSVQLIELAAKLNREIGVNPDTSGIVAIRIETNVPQNTMAALPVPSLEASEPSDEPSQEPSPDWWNP